MVNCFLIDKQRKWFLEIHSRRSVNIVEITIKDLECYISSVESLSCVWLFAITWTATHPNRCPFHYRGLECKSRKSRNTWSNWSNWQIWPWNMEWSRAKTNRVLPRKCTGHSKHPFPTTQEKTLYMDITRWSTLKSDWLYYLQPKTEKFYTVSITITLCTRQQKRRWCMEQSYGLCGRGWGWEDLGEWHWNM